jgi:hypothetical protein
MLIVTHMPQIESSIERSPLQVAIDPGLKKKIIEVAKREGISQAEVMRRAFVFYYASQN